MRFDQLFGKKSGSSRRWDEGLERDQAFRRAILAVPTGKVSTYGKIAEAAGYPGYHRAVARLLGGGGVEVLPWHRIVGAGGAIKTSGASAKEQRARLREEGVAFRGERVDLSVSLYQPGRVGGRTTEE